MREALTISEVLADLLKRGYSEDFKAQNGRLVATPSGQSFDPACLEVDEFFRFEGETDLNEEAIIFALHCPKTGVKGTYLIAFGSMMDPSDAQVVHQLEFDGKRKG